MINYGLFRSKIRRIGSTNNTYLTIKFKYLRLIESFILLEIIIIILDDFIT